MTQGHDYVEIGGVKWATMNVGASTVYDTGLYFQWGDTKGYTREQFGTKRGQKHFDWYDYKWIEDEKLVPTKYNEDDEKTVIDPEDDAVHAAWGGDWCMPTMFHFWKLEDASNIRKVKDYERSGVNGLLFTDKEDSSKKLFFPASGLAITDIVLNENVCAYLWGNTLCPDMYPHYAEYMYFKSERIHWSSSTNRYLGMPCRGVLFD